jgi:hypothetical protein
MSLLDATSGARAALQALKFDLLGPLAIDGIASLAHLKSIDLARYFARFAELGAPVPRSLLATLCAEVARLTGAAVSSEVVSSWGAVPLPLAAGAGADAIAGPSGAALSVVPGFAPRARVAAGRAAAPAPLLAAATAPLLAAAPAAAAACVIDESAARQALEMLAKAVPGRADLLARVREMEKLLDAPAPATSAAPAAPPTTVSLADTAAANASSGPMDVEAAPLADAAAPDAAASASDLTLDALREWLASVSEAVRADAKHAACNARHVRIMRRRRSAKDFDGAVLVAEAADHDYIIAPADARGSATRIFPSAGAPREQRDLVARVRTSSATRRAPRRSKTPPCSRRCRNACSRPRSRPRATRGTCASCGSAR